MASADDPAQDRSLVQDSWMEKVRRRIGVAQPRSRDELVEQLRSSEAKGLIDADGLSMIEGVLHVSELQARDIMIPRSQVTTLERDSEPKELLPTIVQTGYSRFPVSGETKDDVIGILLAKDLLRIFHEEGPGFRIREVLRPVLFIPESKRLDALLKQFRESRNHMSVVVDEYGGLAGIVTIEDVIEQIVGEIDDEHDFDEDAPILSRSDGSWIVKAVAPIDAFNEALGADLKDDDLDTVGGMVAQRFGHVPRRGERIIFAGFEFRVLRADNRRIHLLRVIRVGEESSDDSA
ncbi:CBS domain-containing protein [Halorhodospira halochloris]|uniref:Magnesium and cobalt efflux protein CorC n=1 Tax=Halorhodospira halochloris TaxID=1052 RepID=A0A110B4P7_HALHR|nr:transporter associated domain-containing protein [Halorhodospira halochloris]MBK1652431.1 magnesium/cobalt efflux protein [Halorhodospira halochloris]MCG5529518.1 CBS domain-containing protein [Halorhodospira halochloris]MCG5547495.1 CBS domain-containing protein [Halorhodospira halochloris]BAU56322.1 magnesium and cobalt efflux protein CorC [Halorhodospira halochloris]